jgi:uncharacterized protein
MDDVSLPDGPKDEHHHYRRLDGRVLKVWQIENVVGSFVLIALTLGLFHGPLARTSWSRWEIPVLVAIAASGGLDALLLIPRRHRYYRFGLVGDCVVIVRGKFILRRSTYPLPRILYVQTRQGPVLRRYGLVKVHLGTIAGPHSLGPLSQAEAEEFRGAVEAGSRAQ